MKHIFALGILTTALTFASGCSWFSQDDLADDPTMPNVPHAMDDSAADYTDGMGPGEGFGSGKTGWGEGADESTVGEGAVDADGWRIADPTGNRLNMPVIYFAYDSDELIASQQEKLNKIAAFLDKETTLGIVIEGHCDQRGTEEYNRALGERRANAIRAYLAGQGLADSRMKTVSYGEDKPAVEGDSEDSWKQNRRGVPVPMIMPRQ